MKVQNDTVRIKAQTIADFLEAELRNGDPEIDCVVSLDNVKEGSLFFILDAKTESITGINGCKRVLALVTADVSGNIDFPHIIVDEPRTAFARAVKRFFQKKPIPYIAKTAVIGKNVHIGESVSIGEYSVIEGNVSIGDGTEIRHHVVISENTVIGRSCLVRSNCVIGEEGMGIASDNADGNVELIPQLGNVIIGDNVETGTFTTINRGTLDSTIIKNNVKIGHHVNIGHNVIINENCILASCCEVSGSSIVEENCWIGINACVLEHKKIGRGSKIGMGAVIVKDVGPNKIMVGNPGRVLRDRK